MGITTVRLQPDLEQDLEAAASKLQRSKSWLINQALREYLERDAVERLRWRQTMEALDDVAQGNVVSGDDVHAWLQSWGGDAELPQPKSGP